METRHILASLSYFSIFFAGFILPLVIWIIADDRYVKRHAGRALISHILPYVLLIFIIISFFTGDPLVSGASILVFFLIIAIIFVWNVVMGVRILLDARRYSR